MSLISDYAPFLVTGIAVGSIYGISSMGLVLTYKTSGLFNFGHGAVAAAAAYAFYDLRQLHGVPWPVTAVIVLLIIGVGGGLLLERMARGLADVPTSSKIVATVGLLIVLQQAAEIRYGATAVPFTSFLPTQTVAIGSVNITYGQLVVLALALGASGALYVFFSRTRLGTSMRAVVDDPDLLDMTGANPVRVRQSSWIIGALFAATSGCLIADRQQQLIAAQLTLLVVQTFGAAAIARFTSLPMAYIGGLIVGVVQAVLGPLLVDLSNVDLGVFRLPDLSRDLAALPDASAFLILFGFLLFLPKGRLVEVGRSTRTSSARSRSVPVRVRVGGAAGSVLLLGAVPALVGTKLALWSTGMVFAVVFLSLSLLVRLSGQVSLCHYGFLAVGAATSGQLISFGHLPWLLGVLLGALCAVPFGVVVAIPAIRLSGLFLGLATLGFGVLLQQLFYNRSWFFTSGPGVPSPRPHVLGLDTDTGYYYVCLISALLVAAVVLVVQSSRMGRLLRGLADSPIALVMHGASVNVTRVLVFGLSAFIAGLAGALLGPLTGFTNSTAFQPLLSLSLLAVFAISGRGTVVPAFVAALLFQVLPGYRDDPQLTQYLNLGFGASAILVSIGGFRERIGRSAALAHAAGRGVRGPAQARMRQRAAASQA
jgi:ABC-type branched-subunit amino acid transport system permease subunit